MLSTLLNIFRRRLCDGKARTVYDMFQLDHLACERKGFMFGMP